MNIVETFLAYSIEQFLTPEELSWLSRSLQDHVSGCSANSANALTRGRSIHSIGGLSLNECTHVYSPKGRTELEPLPRDIFEFAQSIFDRNLGRIRRSFPSARRSVGWTYIGYQQGQFIVPHIDFASDHGVPGTEKVAAISVALNGNYSGGEFFIETCSAKELWNDIGNELRSDATPNNDWFLSMPKTRWIARPLEGDALLVGSRLVHGTLPVIQGVAQKLLGFIMP